MKKVIEIMKLNTVGPANFVSHRLVKKDDLLAIVPRKRAAFGEYFMCGGISLMGLMFTMFLVDGQIDFKPFSMIIAVLGTLIILLRRLFRRGYNKVIFDKQCNLVYSTYQKDVCVPLSDIALVGIKRMNNWGGLVDDHSGYYRAYVIVLHDNAGQLYSVVSHAGHFAIEAMAVQIANYIGVELVDMDKN
ncbi:hypothetical protein [Alteromonas facilis]|uniref:hypothetical protein n=1 Tax=Alteromonas facilis TaxID=2048004 RepID=UPI000C29583E|nr:hypothetical protein [Alteromonas facilis]